MGCMLASVIRPLLFQTLFFFFPVLQFFFFIGLAFTVIFFFRMKFRGLIPAFLLTVMETSLFPSVTMLILISFYYFLWELSNCKNKLL